MLAAAPPDKASVSPVVSCLAALCTGCTPSHALTPSHLRTSCTTPCWPLPFLTRPLSLLLYPAMHPTVQGTLLATRSHQLPPEHQLHHPMLATTIPDKASVHPAASCLASFCAGCTPSRALTHAASRAPAAEGLAVCCCQCILLCFLLRRLYSWPHAYNSCQLSTSCTRPCWPLLPMLHTSYGSSQCYMLA
jgi:hypothetical protein